MQSFRYTRVIILAAIIIVTSVTTSPVDAWGISVHKVIGRLVRKLLPDDTRRYMDRLLLLPNGNIEDYGEAAVWADTIPPAKNPLAYTKPYHYVSLPQNGVGQCSKYTSRTSCTNDACMVTGFETFTKKFQCNPRNKQNQRAIRFLLHFLGDISQPLHILDFHRGGTTLFHQWRGQSMSLHYIWDTAMPNQLLRDNIDEYVQELERKIKGGDYKKYVSDWNQCLTDNERNPNACIVPWIDKFNAFFNCKILLPKYEQLKRSKDFSVDYYAQHKAYLPVLWARAAVRAAKYITLFLEPCVNPTRTN